MAHYSDSSDVEDLEDILKQVAEEEGVIGESWAAEGEPDEDTPPDEGPEEVVKMTARAYQLEMLEASLKENVIVAMDTGSGKTQV